MFGLCSAYVRLMFGYWLLAIGKCGAKVQKINEMCKRIEYGV